MMKKLMEKVIGLVGDELEEANKNNPPLFHSTHEGYGVIAEEMMEVRNEYEMLDMFQQNVLYAIHRDDWEDVSDSAFNLGMAAIKVACECIQVAAMCDKLRQTVEANVE